MHGMLTPVCIHPRIQTVNRAHSRTSGISSACQAIKPMSSPASVPHSKRAAPRVTRSDFDVAQGRLDLYLDFPRGARFGCSVAGCDQGSCPVHDTEDKTWRHMDFFQYKAFLHARVPRTRCPEHGVHLVEVVWARPESGFTLLFEALLIEFATAMPVARVAAMTREHDTRIWRVAGASRGRATGEVE